jgi:hypothetical protein
MAATNVQAFSGDVEVAGGLSITGSVTSTAGIDKVNLATDGTNASRSIIFSTGTSGAQPLKTDAGLTYNPSTNKLTVAGGVDNLTLAEDSTNTNRRVLFSTGSTGAQSVKTDAGLVYNPSTNKLTTTTFSGALDGNASSSTNVRVDRYDTGDTAMYITMVNNATESTSKRLYMDNGLIYDNTNNRLRLKQIMLGDQNVYGLGAVAGDYGSVGTVGTGKGSYEGFNINGQWVFMSNGAGSCGIYNDTNNHWATKWNQSGSTDLYYNNSNKFQTTNDGAHCTGALYADHYYLDDYIYHNGNTTTRMGFGSNTIYLRTNGTDRVTIDSSGNTNLSSSTLKVNGSSTFVRVEGANIRFSRDNDTYYLDMFQVVEGSGKVGYRFKVYNNGSTYNSLTLSAASGNVGINDVTPSYKLDVAGTFRATSRISANDGVDFPAPYGYCAILAGSGDGASYTVFNSRYRTWWSIGVADHTNTCRINFDARSGNILGTGSVGSTSDDRIKINEKRITRAMDTISKLDPQLYHKTNKSSILPKEGEDVRYQTESGLIAQDIWYDAPELRHLVLLGTGADPAIEKPYRNPDITIDPDYSGWGPEPSTVNYIGLIPYLIKSVQEIATELPNVKTGVSNVNVSNVDNYHGLIVSVNKPDIYISTSSYDTKCYGVVSEENVDTINNEILINTSRDGKIWVIDCENLQSGDYITTSNVAGYGMKQSDDLVHNYTVAKILQDCDFNPTQVPVKRVARETRDVTYYVKREYSDVPQDGSEAYIHDNKIVEIDEVYYTKSTLVEVQADEDYTSRTFTPEITEEAYDTLDESDRESYAVTYFNTKIKDIRFEEYESLSASEKEEYEQMTRRVKKIMKLIETKDPLPGYEIETRTEEVDVLDSNGQLVWEETSETRVSYTTKYIDGAGVETDEANAVHKAALVNCKVML